MKRLLLSLSMLGMASILAIGATTAYFSDTEVSSANTFTAGTLDLKVDGGDEDVLKFNLSNLKPGNQPKSYYLLKNAGTINGKVSISATSLTDYENGCLESENDSSCGDTQGELSQALGLTIYFDNNKDGYFSTGDVYIFNGQFSELPSVLSTSKNLAPGEETKVMFVVNWWENHFINDNLAQGDSLVMDLEFTLEQI